ncbi:MAG: glycogen/starch/alpha-glucan phosphorylase [Eubacteriales bacterium SKADARSKE-1]|nr:glycogen/starch/alpha-glucan phosphorylase [Eubacteriales bacterium SKADARSKE-1]
MITKLSVEKVHQLILAKLSHYVGVPACKASNEHIYRAVVLVVEDLMYNCRNKFMDKVQKQKAKQVYYICMEFLLGRSLKNNLFNLKMEDTFTQALKIIGISIDDIYEQEADAALGNGGLGRLAACFLDALASGKYPSTGYSLRYEYGVFRQKLVDGWQTELPDFWLPSGSLWLTPRPEESVKVLLDGKVKENWNGPYHQVTIEKANEVVAVPYDMMISGYNCNGVSKLRLWAAESRGFNMDLFNRGDYAKAMEQDAMASAITKVLYPADNHPDGKSLRLSQQYFLVSATIQDIVRRHLRIYNTLDNLSQKAAIHLNDTHPVLAIPELMRIMLDDCGYTWEKAWSIITQTFAYTNHTVMSEALEIWNEELFKRRLPRIYQIVEEINKRYFNSLTDLGLPLEQIERMVPINCGTIYMPNLAIVGSHSINGVSELHSQILKDKVFKDFYKIIPDKFLNVTNGIAHRRWLNQSNPKLSELITELIGDKYITEPTHLQTLLNFKDDESVLKKLKEIKLQNKIRLVKYIKDHTGISVDPTSIFDSQVKRLHEYKRQLMNALDILSTYISLKENPKIPFIPKTYIFSAKAASGYYFAKKIIKLIVAVNDLINNDPTVNDKLKSVFLEDYRVTLAEILIPATEISEQISLAGTEASGTSNMKFMLNGAITLGTMDGANIEIYEAVGSDNIIAFGMNAKEVNDLKKSGYNPMTYYNNNCAKSAINKIATGIGSTRFEEIASYLITRDPYMVLADFSDYDSAQKKASRLYSDSTKWNKMSLINIANAGRFSADISVKNYSDKIWHNTPLK